jgi:hypothetical protein
MERTMNDMANNFAIQAAIADFRKKLETWSTAEIIEYGWKTRDTVAAIKKQHAQEVAVYEAALESCENRLHAIMLERGEKNIRTEKGTAYLSDQIRVSMINRDALVEYVYHTGDFSFFTNHVAKDAVKAYMDQNSVVTAEGNRVDGPPPPGVEVETFVACHIRKP